MALPKLEQARDAQRKMDEMDDEEKWPQNGTICNIIMVKYY